MNAIVVELRHKPLSAIRISDLCRHTNYPRSTFYKYYYDLEDLFSDYLDHVWRSLEIREKDPLQSILNKLLLYQKSTAENASIYRANRNDGMFDTCMKKVLQEHLLNFSFHEELRQENISISNEFVTDYIIRMFDLLMQYQDTMEESHFRQVTDLLLNRKVC